MYIQHIYTALRADLRIKFPFPKSNIKHTPDYLPNPSESSSTALYSYTERLNGIKAKNSSASIQLGFYYPINTNSMFTSSLVNVLELWNSNPK